MIPIMRPLVTRRLCMTMTILNSRPHYFEYHRTFSTKTKKYYKKDDPFRILGVSESDPYKLCKQRFLKIAMTHHPDTCQYESEEEKIKMRDTFISARRAFESLAEGPDGEIILQTEAEHMKNFDSWFKRETGHDNPFDVDMDAKTMKEVADMTEQVGGGVGLDRDGGMWTLAKMVAQTVKNGGDGTSMLRLESGDVKRKDDSIGTLRRKRKPKNR